MRFELYKPQPLDFSSLIAVLQASANRDLQREQMAAQRAREAGADELEWARFHETQRAHRATEAEAERAHKEAERDRLAKQRAAILASISELDPSDPRLMEELTAKIRAEGGGVKMRDYDADISEPELEPAIEPGPVGGVAPTEPPPFEPIRGGAADGLGKLLGGVKPPTAEEIAQLAGRPAPAPAQVPAAAAPSAKAPEKTIEQLYAERAKPSYDIYGRGGTMLATYDPASVIRAREKLSEEVLKAGQAQAGAFPPGPERELEERLAALAALRIKLPGETLKTVNADMAKRRELWHAGQRAQTMAASQQEVLEERRGEREQKEIDARTERIFKSTVKTKGMDKAQEADTAIEEIRTLLNAPESAEAQRVGLIGFFQTAQRLGGGGAQRLSDFDYGVAQVVSTSWAKKAENLLSSMGQGGQVPKSIIDGTNKALDRMMAVIATRRVKAVRDMIKGMSDTSRWNPNLLLDLIETHIPRGLEYAIDQGLVEVAPGASAGAPSRAGATTIKRSTTTKTTTRGAPATPVPANIDAKLKAIREGLAE